MKVKLIRFTPEPDALCGEAAAICTGYTGDPLKALRGGCDAQNRRGVRNLRAIAQRCTRFAQQTCGNIIISGSA